MNGTWRYAFVCVLTAMTLLFATGHAAAAPTNPQVLYAFCSPSHHCTDEQNAFGYDPVDVIAGSDGAYYGMTSRNIANVDEHGNPVGGGDIYRANPVTRTLSVLYHFRNYYSPEWLKSGRDGYLYGGYTRYDPVDSKAYEGFFRLSLNGEFANIREYSGTAQACSALVQDSLGNWVGISAPNTIFELTPGGDFKTLYTFADSHEMFKCPHYEPVLAADGNLYGVISGNGQGGLNDGAIYRLAPDDTVTILHQFNNDENNGSPDTPLTIGSDGALYGVAGDPWHGPSSMLYRMSLDGQFTNLGAFGPNSDGGLAMEERLTLMPDGYFYGSAFYLSGSNANIIFRLSNTGEYTWLASRSLSPDPSEAPRVSPLIRGFDNALYGTTSYGGKYSDKYDGGTLFRYVPPPVQ